MTDIEKQVAALRYAPDEVQQKVRAIYDATLRESRCIRTGDFDAIAAEDVERLVRLYDDAFFGGLYQRLLSREGEGCLSFHVSRRLTRAGGKTTVVHRRAGPPTEGQAVTAYELAVSATLLFQTFQGEERVIVVAGIECADRLEALQRIVEHEMIHLLEFLVWRTSSCARERFRNLARNLFAHTESHHELVTPREIAHGRGIKVGSRVTFEYQGAWFTGRVNQVTKRVTVLVDHPKGSLYSDGKRYMKFYVPMEMLALADT